MAQFHCHLDNTSYVQSHELVRVAFIFCDTSSWSKLYKNYVIKICQIAKRKNQCLKTFENEKGVTVYILPEHKI